MARVPIDELACGMVLAHDVSGKNGRLLLTRGMALAANQLRVLRIWGITEVEILGDGGDAAQAVPGGAAARAADATTDMAAAVAAANARFALAGRDQAAAAELYRLCLKELSAPGRCALPPGRLPAGEADAGALPAAPATPEDLVAGDPSLATFSDIYFRLEEAIRDPGASAGQIAGIIGRDPGLAASLLRLANSPFYALGRPIESLARGVLVIGAGELAQLVLGLAVVERFKDIPSACLTMRQTWEHAVGCGVMARVLAAQVGGVQEERLFVAGLLHDLGRLVMLGRLPRHVARSMALARETGLALWQAEREILGFDHAGVGRALLAYWQLPQALAEAVGDHHDGAARHRDAAIVHVADAAAVAVGFGSNGSPLVPPVNDAAWVGLGLPPSALAVAVSQARRQVADIVSTLLPG
ncbi:HDOD domain-containing protein [Solidesulfovibrio sp.]